MPGEFADSGGCIPMDLIRGKEHAILVNREFVHDQGDHLGIILGVGGVYVLKSIVELTELGDPWLGAIQAECLDPTIDSCIRISISGLIVGYEGIPCNIWILRADAMDKIQRRSFKGQHEVIPCSSMLLDVIGDWCTGHSGSSYCGNR